ncbi:MAG TPA: hypothetical protein V6D30_20540 [Leptolyngbyaceae cyanobacterium]
MTGKTGTKLDKQNMDSGTRLQKILVDQRKAEGRGQRAEGNNLPKDTL